MMKRFLTLSLILFSSLSALAQSGSLSNSGIFLRVNDSTTYRSAAAAKHALGYSDIYWNNQATTPHFDIWNGSSYDHVFVFGSGSSGGGVALNQKTETGTTYTVTDADNNYVIHFSNASGVTVTMPNTIADDTYITFIRDEGAGVITFAEGGTSVFKTLGNEVTIDEEKAWSSWIKDGATDWYAAGGLGPLGGGGGTWGSITGTLSDQTDLQSALNAKAPLASPTFTGTVVLPSATSIGTITNTELSYVDGVTSAIQTQFSGKEPILTSSSTSTASGTVTLDMNSLTQKIFYGSASFATSKTMAFSNTTNALVFTFHFEITNVAGTVVFPANVVMSDPLWDTATQTWTPLSIGLYEMVGRYNAATSNWKVSIDGPYN
jgi:hypothetical protein